MNFCISDAHDAPPDPVVSLTLLYLEKYVVPIGHDFHLFGYWKVWKIFFEKCGHSER